MSLTDVVETPLDRIGPIVDECRSIARSGATAPIAWRIATLKKLKAQIQTFAPRIEAALATDLGRPEMEAWAADIGMVLADIDQTITHLPAWMEPEKVPTPMAVQPGTSSIIREPLGVVCVIAPWNYPFQLLLLPVVAAIAAGNAVVAKPSEIAPTCAAVIGEIIESVGEPALAVVQGGVAETTELLEQRFDHIMYTGNGHVGRIVMRAAAEHLTPVTLELGGKCPTVVTSKANLEVTASRVAFGKFFNAGQTCLAPDYVLVEDAVHEQFLEAIKTKVTEFYGTDPEASKSFGRIVSEPHFHRIEKLLDSGNIVVGGGTNADTRFIAPTVLRDITADDPVMAEEIFGPVLPVLSVSSLDAAIDFVNAGDKPLAAYIFTDDEAEADTFLAHTSSGGAMVNGALTHAVNPNLPFGGVGESGMGAYHGKFGFETFSHHKALVARPTKSDPPMLYPPYGAVMTKVVKKAMLIPEPRDVFTKIKNRLFGRR